jgi:toxin CcdB
MAQFDVHQNRGRNRVAIPYVVAVQSSRLDSLPTRLVIPLVLPSPSYRRDPRLAPALMVEGREVVLHAWEMQAVPLNALGPVVASLADDNAAAQIIGAIDEVISRAYG